MIARPDIIHISQGEHAVGTRPEQVITTLLGSCVSVCLHDPVHRRGGMNHILLPEAAGAISASTSYGALAMELLINDLLKSGAQKSLLVAKIFGGSRMVAGLSSIGDRNIDFALNYLANESIAVSGRSVGGTAGRRLQFWPYSGKARQKMMNESVMEVETQNLAGNEVELF